MIEDLRLARPLPGGRRGRQRRFQLPPRGLEVALGEVDLPKPATGRGLGRAVPELGGDRHGLAQGVPRRREVAQVRLGLPDAALRHRLAAAIPVLAAQLQRLPVQGQGLRGPAALPLDEPEVVQGRGLSAPVLDLAEEVAGALEADDGSVALVELAIGVADVAQHPPLPAPLSQLVEDRQRLGVARHGGVQVADAPEQHTEVVQGLGLAAPVARRGELGKRPAIVREGFLRLPQVLGDASEVGAGGALDLCRVGALDRRQRGLVAGAPGLELALGELHQAEVARRGRDHETVALSASERRRGPERHPCRVDLAEVPTVEAHLVQGVGLEQRVLETAELLLGRAGTLKRLPRRIDEAVEDRPAIQSPRRLAVLADGAPPIERPSEMDGGFPPRLGGAHRVEPQPQRSPRGTRRGGEPDPARRREQARGAGRTTPAARPARDRAPRPGSSPSPPAAPPPGLAGRRVRRRGSSRRPGSRSRDLDVDPPLLDDQAYRRPGAGLEAVGVGLAGRQLALAAFRPEGRRARARHGGLAKERQDAEDEQEAEPG